MQDPVQGERTSCTPGENTCKRDGRARPVTRACKGLSQRTTTTHNPARRRAKETDGRTDRRTRRDGSGRRRTRAKPIAKAQTEGACARHPLLRVTKFQGERTSRCPGLLSEGRLGGSSEGLVGVTPMTARATLPRIARVEGPVPPRAQFTGPRQPTGWFSASSTRSLHDGAGKPHEGLCTRFAASRGSKHFIFF